MNNVGFHLDFYLCTSLIQILFIIKFASTATTLHPIIPCHYPDVNQRLFKCDMCTCLSSSLNSFSTGNLCSSIEISSLNICSTNLTKNYHEQILRSRLNEIEFESMHSSTSQYPTNSKRFYNDFSFEFDYFNQEVWRNFLNFDQNCASVNSSRLTFYRFQMNSKFSNTFNPCSISLLSLRFLDSNIENNLLPFQSNPEILIFYNTSFHQNYLNISSTTTILSFYYSQFLGKPFQLNSLSNLAYLTISHTKNFEIFGSFSNLIFLDLCHTQLDDQQLNRIFKQVDMPDLTTLILANNQIAQIKTRFPSTIRYLDLSSNRIKSLDYISFKSLYSLNTLNLSFNFQLDIQVDTFSRIPYLEVLDLSSCFPVSPIDDLFLPLQKLRHLNISDNQLNSIPKLPIPYDAHAIISYDQHLPVLYVDMSKNNLNQIDFDVLSSASTQDKYIISIDVRFNQLKTIQLPISLSTGVRRRGPLIELNVHNNPLECDCTLYENLSPLFKNDFSSMSSSMQNEPSNGQQSAVIPSGFYVNSYSPNGHLIPSASIQGLIRSRRQYLNPIQSTSNILAQNLMKQARVKFINLTNINCRDIIEHKKFRNLFDLSPSNSFCSYTKHCPSSCSCCSSTSTFLYSNDECQCYNQCPSECSCKRSYDFSQNYVNCSYRALTQLPSQIPRSATHLNLDHNLLNEFEKSLTTLTNLKSLSINHNRLDSLSDDDFTYLSRLEELDLSSNQISKISSKTFGPMFKLKHLYLHNNPWIPKFYLTNDFQSNIQLNYLTYGPGLTCNRSVSSSSLVIEKGLTGEDCCKESNIESCQTVSYSNEDPFRFDQHPSSYNEGISWSPKGFLKYFIEPKYRIYLVIIFISLIIVSIGLLIFFCICCSRGKKISRKRTSAAERKLLPNGHESKKNGNDYNRSLPLIEPTTPQISSSSSTTAIQKLIHSTRQKTLTSNGVYRQHENDASASYTDNDEDDYASIPLTMSQNDLAPVIRTQPPVPPLPPPRQVQSHSSFSNRPVSHSSTTSTSTTIRSIPPIVKRTNSSVSKQLYQPTLTSARSCLQIKLDALVLYSISDSEFIHGNLSLVLEEIYGRRFSFHFIHRDRMLGELEWLIENSCVTILILRKPYHIVHDYMKVLSTCSSIKIFLILINDGSKTSSSSSSLKAREKIAKLYRTSEIYEWNPNSQSLLHEQLELFLERHCGSATYVPY